MKKRSNKVINKKVLGIILGILIVIVFLIGFAIFKYINNENDIDGKMDTSSVAEKEYKIEQYNIADMVKLCDYSNLQITIDIPETVTDADMEKYINYVLRDYPKYELLEKTKVEADDTVQIDLTGKLAGENEYVLEEKDLFVNISDTDMLKEILDSLIGKNVNEEFCVKYTYPDNFADANYSGKTIEFTVLIKGIYKASIIDFQNLDDEFAKETLGCRTVDQFVSQIKAEMYEIITYCEETAITEAVVNKVINTSAFSIPEEYYDLKVLQEKELFINLYCNGDAEIYEEQIYSYTGLSAEDYEKSLYSELESVVKFEIIASLIAKEKNYSTEDALYEQFLAEQMEAYNISDVDVFYSTMGTSVESGQVYMEKQFYINQVTEYLVGLAQVQRTENASIADYMFNN